MVLFWIVWPRSFQRTFVKWLDRFHAAFAGTSFTSKPVMRFVLVVTVTLTLVACDVASVGEPAANTAQRSAQTSAPVELKTFDPQLDEQATQMLFIDPARYVALAAHYRSNGYNHMALAVETADRAVDGEVSWDWMLEPQPDGAQWSCPDIDDAAVYDAAKEIDAAINASDFAKGRTVGQRAVERLGPACPLLVETAVATLGMASTGADVAASDLELAFRTLVTGDLEMRLQTTAGPPEWPYQLATYALAGKGKHALAYVSAGMAVRRMEMRASIGHKPTAAGEKAIRELFRAAGERMRKR
jgi:hypothetical protein